MNNEAFSEIRALLGGVVPPLPMSYESHGEYVGWHKHLLKAFRAMFHAFQSPEETAEIWGVLNPYLERHPGLLKTLTGMAASQSIMRGEKAPWSLEVARAGYALVAYHRDIIPHHQQGLMQWVACHIPVDFQASRKSLLPAYKDPFPLDTYEALWVKAPHQYTFVGTIFGSAYPQNRSLHVGSRDVFVSVHSASHFFEDVAAGDLIPYTKEYVMSAEGNDWSSYVEGRWDYSEINPEYSPEGRLAALEWKYANNVYATVLVDPSGIMTYIPDVCYDLPKDASSGGFYYDCYE